MPLNIAIVGGGIAGLAAAIALGQRGFRCDLYEQASELKELGFGIQLSPNALHCLAHLGVAVAGHNPINLRVISGSRQVATMSMAGFVTLKRDVLHQALLARARDFADIHLNAHINEIEADVVIAANGVHSGFRKDASIDSGFVAWRRVTSGFQQDVVLELNKHRVSYAVTASEINEVITNNGEEIAGFTGYKLLTRPFSGGIANTILIGDAAHAMMPHLGQGAAMALEDAVVLGRMFDTSNIAQSLRAFEAMRKPRVERVARAAFINGYIYKMPKPFSWARDAVMLTMSEKRFKNRYNWIYNERV